MSELKLPEYQSIKVVSAAKISNVSENVLTLNYHKVAVDIAASNEYMERHNPKAGGYYVRYEDGYESYSPSDVFEAGYLPVETVCSAALNGASFGIAIEMLKDGHRMARKGWNGKDQFVYLVTGNELASALSYGFGEYLGEPNFVDMLVLRNAKNELSTWVPSIGDLMAEDWIIAGVDAETFESSDKLTYIDSAKSDNKSHISGGGRIQTMIFCDNDGKERFVAAGGLNNETEHSKAQLSLEEQIAVQTAQISAGAPITKLTSDLAETNAAFSQKTTSYLGTLTSRPIVELTDAANDVLYALFFRGALASGDLPAKSGVAELHTLGFAETGHVKTKYQGEDYFTWLTRKGQEFAIGYLVKTNFGKFDSLTPIRAADNSSSVEKFVIDKEGAVKMETASIEKPLIANALIGGGAVSKRANICGNTVEQDTLSKALASVLPELNPKEFNDVAVKMASAVKSAFNVLDCEETGPSDIKFNFTPSTLREPE